MPSATGQNWEKYQKKFDDDEEPEKKITPLTDEYDTSLYHFHVVPMQQTVSGQKMLTPLQGYTSPQNLWRRPIRRRHPKVREANKGKTSQRQ